MALGLTGARLGLLLQVAAVVTGIALIGGTVTAWRVLGRMQDVAERGAAVSLAALDAVDASLSAADELLEAARTSIAATATTLRTVDRSFDEAAEALASVSQLTTTAAPALESARGTLQTLEGVGRTIDGTLSALSRVPFGPDYDPERAFGVTIGRLADDLAPLPAALRATGADLDRLVRETAALERDLDTLTAALDEVTTGLEDSDDLLAGYRDAAADARRLAEDADEGLGADLVIARMLLVLGGLGLTVGQTVPFLWGAGLRRPA